MLSHLHSRNDIYRSVVYKMSKGSSYLNYFYYFDISETNRNCDTLIQVTDEEAKIVEEILLIFKLTTEIGKYGLLEEGCSALIEAINQQSGIYLEKDIDYKIIGEIVQGRKKYLIQGN